MLSIIELYSASSFEIAKQGLYAPLLRHVSMLFVGFLIIVGLQRGALPLVCPDFSTYVLRKCRCDDICDVFRRIRQWCPARHVVGFFMSLQPAEFIKLTTVLILAVILSRTQLKKSPGLRNRGIIYAASGRDRHECSAVYTRSHQHSAAHGHQHVHDAYRRHRVEKKFLMVLGVYAVVGVAGMGVKMAMSADDDKKI